MKVSRILVPCVLILGAISACASANTQFFTLDARAPVQVPPGGRAVGPIQILAVHVPAELDRLELVEQTHAYGITVHDLARWSAPLGQMARRVLTQDLLARLPQGSVVFPEAPKPSHGIEIEVSILSLSRANGRAVIDVSWTASNLGDRIGPQLSRTIRLTVPKGDSPGSAAEELSEAVAKLADAIMLDLTRRV